VEGSSWSSEHTEEHALVFKEIGAPCLRTFPFLAAPSATLVEALPLMVNLEDLEFVAPLTSASVQTFIAVAELYKEALLPKVEIISFETAFENGEDATLFFEAVSQNHLFGKVETLILGARGARSGQDMCLLSGFSLALSQGAFAGLKFLIIHDIQPELVEGLLHALEGSPCAKKLNRMDFDLRRPSSDAMRVLGALLRRGAFPALECLRIACTDEIEDGGMTHLLEGLQAAEPSATLSKSDFSKVGMGNEHLEMLVTAKKKGSFTKIDRPDFEWERDYHLGRPHQSHRGRVF
jgi:hypothetical protein